MNIKLDSNRDWDVQKGQLQFVTGLDEIAQIIEVRLRTFAGEWFLDTTRGVPWFSKVLIKNPNTSEIEELFTQQISDVPGVTAIETLTLEYINEQRSLRVQTRIITTDGVLDFTVEAP